MRTEQEMFDLILNVAKNDERIRAVYMNGSRTNPNVPKDIFQDYDIAYVVTETKSFINDEHWIDIFGEILIMQKPDELDSIAGNETHFHSCYGYLMQFKDGNRIDLHISTLDFVLKQFKEDKLTITLFDKDNILPKIPDSTDEVYWVSKPTQDLFYRSSNQFWWCLNNVANGLWREEIPYVMDCINYWIRPELVKMLSWYVGTKTNFLCSVGKSGKYLYKYLSEDFWTRFLKTYSGSDIESIWNSVFIMCDLFNEVANLICNELDFKYTHLEATNSFKFLKHVRVLPKDAKEIY